MQCAPLLFNKVQMRCKVVFCKQDLVPPPKLRDDLVFSEILKLHRIAFKFVLWLSDLLSQPLASFLSKSAVIGCNDVSFRFCNNSRQARVSEKSDGGFTRKEKQREFSLNHKQITQKSF